MKECYDAVVVGGGPAGLSAAIYLARAKFSVLVIEQKTFGGQITITDEVVNYPGIVKTSGKALTEGMRKQAEHFGADFLLAQVSDIDYTREIKTVTTEKGTISCVGVILATGSHPRKLGFPGEAQFAGRGIAYCATCDGEFFSGKQIFVIGGGFAAAEEAMFLTKYAKQVTMIIREPDFTCAKTIADQVKQHPKIDLHYHTEIVSASGDGALQKAVFINNETKETWVYEDEASFGIFVFAGYEPANALCKDVIHCTPYGNIITDANQKTNVDGVYAAGDICEKQLRQVVTATSDGAMAATALEKYIPDVKARNHFVAKESKLRQDQPVDVVQTKDSSGFIPAEMKAQLTQLYKDVTNNITLQCIHDGSAFGQELLAFTKEFANLHESFTYEGMEGKETMIQLFVNGKAAHITYHCVPGGHEFTSFALAIYNLTGKKQPIDQAICDQIKRIQQAHDIKVLVSLSCTMCPDVVQAAQRIAIEQEGIHTAIYDLSKYPELKEQYQVMSVPCLVIDETDVHFGRKSIEDILSYLS